ncbi:hypothetical protein SAMN05421858_3395 [Haladaptatus litoreus]|uniref:Uncharacterized protein n=1 Tax=Haladaptatus litoreus TaxID=553468 RepID=A0A1N7D0Y1_9EURY|nr:hypothetical protein SAMN05421858_3395 [Haladaptatus litoreus]
MIVSIGVLTAITILCSIAMFEVYPPEVPREIQQEGCPILWPLIQSLREQSNGQFFEYDPTTISIEVLLKRILEIVSPLTEDTGGLVEILHPCEINRFPSIEPIHVVADDRF